MDSIGFETPSLSRQGFSRTDQLTILYILHNVYFEINNRKESKMKISTTLLLCILFISTETFSQLYQGPAQGTVPSGVMVSTDNFSDIVAGDPLPPYLTKGEHNEYERELLPDNLNTVKPTGPEGSNFSVDQSTSSGMTDAASVLLNNFPGVPRQGSIPPDAVIAAGPSEVVGAVNGAFRIWDKQGNILKSIQESGWLSSLGLGISTNVSDPMVTYDHIAKRWILIWITPPIGSASYDVVCVSDDSIALGTWYNFAFRSDYNGNNSSGVWRDYEGVGYDAEAIYITGNGFNFNSNYIYSKFRIINKAQLYANSGGPVSYFDLWDIKGAGNIGNAFGIRPCLTYGNSNEYYFICDGPFAQNSYVSLYKLTNPLTSPSMTAVEVPTVAYSDPPPSSQLNSTSTITSGGTSGFRSIPVYKNGFLHAVHAVRNDVYSAFSYYKIDVNTNTAVQDVTFGSDGFFYSYPNLSVDRNENVIVTFSRSGFTEYIGAYFTTRSSTDPPNSFSPSTVLQAGRVAISTSRWGDYMGSWLDPAEDNFWIMTEFAETSNGYGVWVGNVRVIPFNTATIFANPGILNYGNIEVNAVSDTQTVKIFNFGNTTLTISNIQVSDNEYHILNAPSLPANLNLNDSILLKLYFAPVSDGVKNDSLIITSNDAINPNKVVSLNGKGYSISPAQTNTVYAVTGVLSNGILMSINSTSGTGTSIGESGYSQLNGLSIRPSNNELYATITSSPETQLVRVNSVSGDAYPVPPIPVGNIRAIAFDLNDLLYCSTTNGALYSYNLSTKDTFFIGSTGISNLYGMSINPVNGSLWGISVSGAVYKINKLNAISASIGTTGISPNTDIAFDKNGVLYGLAGIGTALNKLISIDTSSGAGTLIGTNIGFASTNGLAVSPDIVGIQNITTAIPDKYELYQNYPNPFNPSTSIRFDIPKAEKVQLIIYDMLGKEITKLVNEKLDAGTYEYKFDASSLSSGVYFYRLGSGDLSFTKRMLLIK